MPDRDVKPPYGVIADVFTAGAVVPFLGAGASMVGRPVDPKWTWDASAATVLPSGADLARFLARQAEFPSESEHEVTDLARVSSYFAWVSGRRTLRTQLRQVLRPMYTPGPLHKLLAELPGHHVFVVSNYDTLLEQQFDELGKPYDLVFYPADNRKLAGSVLWWEHGQPEPRKVATNALEEAIVLGGRTVIYKMHGTVLRARATLSEVQASDYDSFVITEEDYVEFLSRMTRNQAIPAMFTSYFKTRSFLFLGYSLRDWNLRVLLQNLQLSRASRQAGQRGDEKIPSWAIQFKPSQLEQKLWAGRDVVIFNEDLSTFAEKLRANLVSKGRLPP